MARHYFRADLSATPLGHPRYLYPLEDPDVGDADTPGGWYVNAKSRKLDTLVYDNAAGDCIAVTDDDALFARLQATGRVTEIEESLAKSEIARLRPPPADVVIAISEAADMADPGLRHAIIETIRNRGHKTSIRVRPGR